MKTYTWEEVSKHNGRNGSYWVVIHGSIHDLSTFLDEHPGGDEVLMNVAGKDGTACFDEVGHSDDAKNLCKKFKIGIIAEHPGGEEVLLEQAGKDGTESFEDVGHSTDAREMMSKYKIGELIEADRRETETKKTPSWSSANHEENNSKWRSWLIPLAFGIVATIVFRFFLKQ